MLALALAAALAMPQTAATNMARKTYSTCLQTLIKAKLDAHLSSNAFSDAARAGCAAEAAALFTALVTYEVSMGARRADAEMKAHLQTEDTLANAVDTYILYASPR